MTPADRPPSPPLELVVDLYAVVYRNDDPRPVRHPLGRLRLTDDDRYRWRAALADVLRATGDAVGGPAAASFDRHDRLEEDPP